jgi:flagellar assembly factor FliW
MLDFLHERIVQLGGSILGFENLNQFSISLVETNSLYAYLQSMEEDNTGFLVISPFSFFTDYAIEIEEKDKKLIDAQSQEEVVVLTFVTLRDPFQTSTTNLLAPLILNVRNGIGRQIVLPPKSNFTTKEPLFKEVQVKSGESSC